MMYICAWPGLATAAAGVDLLQDHGRGAQRQAGAAVFLGDQRAEEAGLGQLVDELGRIAAAVLELAPVFAGKALADLPHGIAQFGKSSPRTTLTSASAVGAVS